MFRLLFLHLTGRLLSTASREIQVAVVQSCITFVENLTSMEFLTCFPGSPYPSAALGLILCTALRLEMFIVVPNITMLC